MQLNLFCSWVLRELPDSSIRNNSQPRREFNKITYNKNIYTWKKTNDKVIANEQPNVRRRVDSIRAELSKLPEHAKS